MDPSEDDLNAQMEELVARVQKEQEELKQAAQVTPAPAPTQTVVEAQAPMAVAKVEESAETHAVASSEPQRQGAVSNVLLGQTPGEKVRTVAALGAGIAIGISFTSIIYGGAVAALGYGAYRYVRWRYNRGEDGETIVDTTAELRG